MIERRLKLTPYLRKVLSCLSDRPNLVFASCIDHRWNERCQSRLMGGHSRHHFAECSSPSRRSEVC